MTVDIDIRPLLTSRDAADVLGISERTLWTLTASGDLPCVRVRRAKRFTAQDLASYIERNKSDFNAPASPA